MSRRISTASASASSSASSSAPISTPISTVKKGDNFEKKVLEQLRYISNLNCNQIKCSGGDGGIDLVGNYHGRLLLLQCKDVTRTISVKDIREFVASVGVYPTKTTLCIFVASNTKKSSNNYNNYKGFSNEAVSWLKNSDYDILLTDISNLQDDLIAHEFRYQTENEEMEKVKEDISTIANEITEIKKSYKKIDEQLSDNRNELIFYVKIIIVILFVFLILYVIKFINDK